MHEKDAESGRDIGQVPQPAAAEGVALVAETLAGQSPGPVGRMPRPNSRKGVLQLQRTSGNAAVARLLSRQSEPAPRSDATLARQSVAGQLDEAAGAHTAGHSLSASVTIAAGQSLPSPPGKTIHTREATRVEVTASTNALSITFSPHMVITNHDPRWYVPDVDIMVQSAEWRYSDQTLAVEWTARNIVNWVGDPGGEMLAAMQGAFSGLPARMQVAGYNPFEDPDLPADLASFASRLGSTAGSSAALPAMSDASVEGSFVLAEELSRPAGDVTVVVPSGSRVAVTATLAGVPTSAADLRIGSLSLSLGGGARINLRALGQDWPVVNLTRATVTAGGHVSADYRILHEDIGTALLGLLAELQAEADPFSAGRIRDDLTVRDEAAHRMIDQKMREELEPMLRDLIIRNTGAIPGLNLQQVLGIEGAAAPVP